jgi:hypothetical protein
MRNGGIILIGTTNDESIVISSQVEAKKEVLNPSSEKPAVQGETKKETPNAKVKTLDGEVSKESIVSRKTIVYETRIDSTVIRLAGEKVKHHLFSRFGLLRPKPEEIQFVSMDKYYEPYIVINGKYSIDYYRKCEYDVSVDEGVKEVVLLNNKFTPEHFAEPYNKISHIKLKGEERIINEAKAFLILNSQGQDTTLTSLPAAPSEKNPKKIIGQNCLKEFNQNADVDFLRQRIAKRPNNVNRIVSENFEVTERSIIYAPRYRLKYANSKTGQERTAEFDGVTSERIQP